MSKTHYEQQKLLIENFRKWESEGEILEEGLGGDGAHNPDYPYNC